MTTSLSLRGVSKFFGDLPALSAVDLSIRPGRVHALVGENGAGKSTLVKILAGLEQPSLGELQQDGVRVSFATRAAAIAQGIGLVPQQLSLIGEMTLVENLIVTQPFQLARRRHAEALLRRSAESAGLAITTDVPVHELGLAERQLGELAIALAQGARILLLDEPTSALGPFESAGLFEHVRALADSGVGVVLITHRIDEVRQIADDVTVLSHGAVALAQPVAEVTDDELVFAMVGSREPTAPRTSFQSGRDRLVISGLTANGAGAQVRNLNVSVRAGEIVGVLGVAGNGQNVLADAAAGLLRPHSGSVTVDGVTVSGRPDAAANAGLAYVPEVRASWLLPDSEVTSSAILRRLRDSRFSSAGVLRWPAITEFTRAVMARHDVRPLNPRVTAGSLSGGNQQKLLVGRELDGGAAVAVLHGPTQGLDLGAAAAIRDEIRGAAQAGTAVLLVSADIDEVHELADRILVMNHGEIVDELLASEFDLQRIGRAMAGVSVSAPSSAASSASASASSLSSASVSASTTSETGSAA
ncbi:ABC transporter ATP-binding protein [Leifsonia kafniensis]|uniref:ABC transporter ATP-binding protein n=1 Tax=Leifsonia kafniensis TaxID=475957 RepID=A0ABP7KUG7_9MICO